MNKPKKLVGMIQSNYIPWRGYFDFIDEVDVFVIYDDVQYTRKDWRNRNTINGNQSRSKKIGVLGDCTHHIEIFTKHREADTDAREFRRRTGTQQCRVPIVSERNDL